MFLRKEKLQELFLRKEKEEELLGECRGKRRYFLEGEERGTVFERRSKSSFLRKGKTEARFCDRSVKSCF